MTEHDVDISDKILLTVDEAVVLSGIGENTIRRLLRDPKCTFVLKLGNRYMVKRRKFEEYLEEIDEI